MTTHDSRSSLPRALRQQLESLARAGVTELPRPQALPIASASSPPLPVASSATVKSEEAVKPEVHDRASVQPPRGAPASPARVDRVDSAHAGPPAPKRPVPIRSESSEEPRALERPGETSPMAKSKSPAPSGNEPVRRTAAAKRAELTRLCDEVRGCTLCPELVAHRTQTVFGVGNVQIRLCFFGEAPGADEDRQGEPFVGRAGQLLNKIIEACTLRREDVYILNTLKCRPPNNRPPEPEEMENCRPFFERQLEILRPEFICCLGRSAATAIFGSKPSLGELRKKIHTWRWARVVVTYHPSYLLRNPAAKKDTWEDMQMLMREMGIQIDGKKT